MGPVLPLRSRGVLRGLPEGLEENWTAFRGSCQDFGGYSKLVFVNNGGQSVLHFKLALDLGTPIPEAVQFVINGKTRERHRDARRGKPERRRSTYR